MRSLVDDPKRRERLVKQLDRALMGLDALDAVASFVKIFEHGYGRPPQALDVSIGGTDQPIQFRFPGSGDPLPAAATGLPAPGPDQRSEG